MTDAEIKIGDVCLDLAQGRPVHVVEDTQQTAAEWSGDNDYDLEANYGNSRFDTGPNDRVFDVVYCSNIKSEPSKTYAMPESRLARVETEKGDDGRPVADRIRVEFLADLIGAWQEFQDVKHCPGPRELAGHAGMSDGAISEARELADVEKTIGGQGGED